MENSSDVRCYDIPTFEDSICWGKELIIMDMKITTLLIICMVQYPLDLADQIVYPVAVVNDDNPFSIHYSGKTKYGLKTGFMLQPQYYTWNILALY